MKTFRNSYISALHITYAKVPLTVSYTCIVVGIWREAMILLEDYSEKYGELHVLAGPLFDYDYDGLRDNLEELSDVR